MNGTGFSSSFVCITSYAGLLLSHTLLTATSHTFGVFTLDVYDHQRSRETGSVRDLDIGIRP